MKYALIGCGRIAVNHIRAALANDLEILAVCDAVLEHMETLLAKYSLEEEKFIHRYANYKEMIKQCSMPTWWKRSSGTGSPMSMQKLDAGPWNWCWRSTSPPLPGDR